MISRFGTRLTLLHSLRHRRSFLPSSTTTTLILSVSAAAAAAATLAATSPVASPFLTRCDDGDRLPTTVLQRTTTAIVSSSPVVSLRATMEATVRALRLVGTTVHIVLDYQFSKVEGSLPFSRLSQEDSKIQELEKEVERCEKDLEDAQMEYAGENQVDNENVISPEDRREIKLKQKARMQQAAQDLANAEHILRSTEGGSSKSALHKQSAERLLKLCRQNGGVYIKVGQHLANLDYLIPQEYIDVLSSLFNDAPRSTFDDVSKVIEEDLGAPIDEIFDRFEPVPIASASLAQVHVAHDKHSGEKLAIKVQHRGLRETSAGDIHAVCLVVSVIDSILKDFTFGWIADEMAPQLPKELDFTLEGKNSEKAQAYIKDSGLACCIPKIIWKHTTPRVLTMKFEEGFKATDIDKIEEAGLKKSDIARLIASVFNSQVFLSGFVHVDPHPANVLIRPGKNHKPEMVLVDHGLYKQLDDSFRVDYAQLWKSLMMADLKGIELSCTKLGVTKMYPLFAAMLTARPYDEIIERSKTGTFQAPLAKDASDSQADKAVIRGYAKQFLSEIFALLGVLPRQMLLLLKMNDCLRHIDMALDSPTNTLVIAGKYASKAIYQHDVQASRSSIDRFKAWLDYMQVLLRINLHNFGVWLADITVD